MQSKISRERRVTYSLKNFRLKISTIFLKRKEIYYIYFIFIIYIVYIIIAYQNQFFS